MNALTGGAQALMFGGMLDSRELRDSLRVQSVACGGVYREWVELPYISHQQEPTSETWTILEVLKVIIYSSPNLDISLSIRGIGLAGLTVINVHL